MKLAAICLFSVVLCWAAELSSAQINGRNYNYRLGSNTNIDKDGLNYQSNNGRHNINLNHGGIGYKYRGNQWNTNVNHGFSNSQTNVDANYRRNHYFRAGYNWQNKQTNVGYTWNIGKRRRRSIDTHDQMLEFLKMESEPIVFLKKLQIAVDMFVKTNQYTVSQLENLSVSVPVYQVTNVTVAEELVCVVKKLQMILPKSLENFTVKMIKFLGPSYDIEDLEDFFSVDPLPEFETADDDGIENACEVPEVPVSNELIDGSKLLEMKRFVASLITVAMEYQQMLEE